MKTALITGASGGIGEVFARRLAARGEDVFLVARSADKLAVICNSLIAEHKVSAQFLALDLAERGAPAAVYEETRRRGLEVETLINNAGYGSVGEFALLDAENELRMIDLNVRTLTELTRLFIGPMRERRRGAVINVASTASFQSVPYMATYGATKAFVLSLSGALWEELRAHGVKVLAVCPGSTATNFFDAAGTKAPPPSLMQSPEEVVDAALAALAAGKIHVVTGWRNYLLAEANRLAPRQLATRITAMILKRRYNPKRANGE